MKTKIYTRNEENPRYVSFLLLKKIIKKKFKLNNELFKDKYFVKLSKKDKSFVKMLITVFIRRNGQANTILALHLNKKPNSEVTILLKIGITQIFFMDVSDYAAVDTTVELTKKLNLNNFTSLVNAVLRKIASKKENLLPKTNIRNNFKISFIKKLELNWGIENTKKILSLFMKIPPLDLTIIKNIKYWEKKLNGMILNKTTIRTNFSGDISKMPGYNDLSWFVQDVAASIPCKLFGEISNKTVFDLCAAPGGKTIQLILKNAKVTSVDINQERLNILKDNLTRLNLKSNLVKENVLNFTPSQKADIILLDPPCTSSGVIRKNPDIILNNTFENLKNFQLLQINLLKKSLQLLKKDGILIFSTCSIFKEEGEDIIKQICESKFAKLIPIKQNELGDFSKCAKPEGWVRILPNSLSHENNSFEQGNDGFFIAKLKLI